MPTPPQQPKPQAQHKFELDLANQPPGYWFALFMKIGLAISIALYLGVHSLNYFANTFKGDQQIFSYLGLATTSVGFIGWLLIFKYMSFTNFEKTIAICMAGISLLGEFYVAGSDILYNTADRILNQSMTFEEIRTMSWIVAGLAFIHGLALVADFVGLEVMVLMQSRAGAKRQLVAEANQDEAKSIRIFVSANAKRVTFSGKTNAFYCPADKQQLVSEYLANPSKWASIEAFLTYANQ